MSRLITGAVHALGVGLLITGYLVLYGMRRLGTLTIGDREQRRLRVAAVQGRTLREAMARLGASFVKLGQVMSSRPDLFEPALIDELKLLQDKLPPFAFPIVKSTLEGELGRPIEQVFAEFDEQPVAAASVAQVHRARLTSGREVAVKVLRPDVRAQVERDGALLLWGARMLALHPVLRLSDPEGFTREFVAGLVRQTDLRVEADNYIHFRKNFEREPRISFPEVLAELCGERVLVMEFVRGVKVDALGGGDHRAVSDALRSATMQMLFVDGFMHADMHPGNMVVRDDGVIVLFDVGLATKLRPEVLDMFVDLMKCIAMGTPDDTVAHLKRYHVYMGAVDWDAMRVDFEAFGKKFRGQDVSQLDYGAMTSDILAIARRYHVHPVPELSLVIVGVVTSQGIGKMLSPGANDFAEKLPDTDEARRAQRDAGLSAAPA
jgi:ubiquinone biosynthesis protein